MPRGFIQLLTSSASGIVIVLPHAVVALDIRRAHDSISVERGFALLERTAVAPHYLRALRNLYRESKCMYGEWELLSVVFCLLCCSTPCYMRPLPRRRFVRLVTLS